MVVVVVETAVAVVAVVVVVERRGVSKRIFICELPITTNTASGKLNTGLVSSASSNERRLRTRLTFVVSLSHRCAFFVEEPIAVINFEEAE